MKKKILSLLLVIALVLSCVFVLASCGGDDSEPDDVTPGGDNVDNSDVKVDEGVGNANGEGGAYVVTDPQSPDAGADTEDGYIHG